jgi:metal-responsive CopG/Arc/MetJ family transcriptional regulator
MNTPAKSKAINISLPAALISRIDKAAEGEYASRSDFIRDSIVRKLNADEQWEVVADFTAIQKGGVDIAKLIERL